MGKQSLLTGLPQYIMRFIVRIVKHLKTVQQAVPAEMLVEINQDVSTHVSVHTEKALMDKRHIMYTMLKAV